MTTRPMGLGRARSNRSWVLPGLLVLSAGYFVVRGPMRAWAGMHDRDLTTLYLATRAWLDGSNPYDVAVLADLAVLLGMGLGAAWSLNTPATFVLLGPLALAPWPLVEKASIVINVLLAGCCIALAMSVAGLHLRQARGLAFAAFTLALAPFHTAISEGQLAIAVAALVVAALHAELRERPLTSGLCIAVAAVLRPQMALIFVLLLLLRGRWKALAGALAGIAVMVGLGLGRMALAGVDWAPTLLSNLARSGVADPTRATATQRLSLHALLDVLLDGQLEAVVLPVSYGLGITAMAILFLRLRHRSDREATLLLYAGCAVITLLLVYNRSYSATMLILPLAWAFAPFRPRSLRAVAVVLCLAIAVFFVPGAAALSLIPPAAVPDWLSGWWSILQVHQVLALIVALAAILAAARPRLDDPSTAGDSPGADKTAAPVASHRMAQPR